MAGRNVRRKTEYPSVAEMDRCNEVADSIAKLLDVNPEYVATEGSRRISLTVGQAAALVALAQSKKATPYTASRPMRDSAMPDIDALVYGINAIKDNSVRTGASDQASQAVITLQSMVDLFMCIDEYVSQHLQSTAAESGD